MKKLRIFVSLICVAALLCSLLVGCSKDPQPTDTVGGDTAGGDVDIEAKIAAEPKKISILVPGFDGSDPDSVYSRAIKRFEEKYGKKVEILQAVGEQLWNEKVAAQIAANDPVDVFYISVDQYLGMYLKNYLLPVDEYVDLNHPLNNKEVMDAYVKFDGKYYAAGVTSTPYVLFYNKDILENNGFDPDEPAKLYEQGEWTWDAFLEIAKECTDLENGVVGLQNMFDEVLQASNGCAAVDYENGQYKLNIYSTNMRNTLEFCQEIFFTENVCGSGYVTGQNRFLKGNAAMHGAYAYELAVFNQLKENGTIKINYGVTAFPVGPDNTEGVNFGHSTGFAISNGSDAPYSAGALIGMIMDEFVIENEKDNSYVSAEDQALFEKLAKNIFVPSYTDGILEKGFGAFYLLWDVRNGGDINQTLAQYETVYQKMIDDANIMLTG